MHKLLPLLLLPLVGACTTTPVAVKAPDGQPATSGTLTVAWLARDTMEVDLGDRHYTGTWTSSLCSSDICRGVFRNVPRIHRRHIRHGEADLVADDGSRLRCTWVSHLPQVRGHCLTDDGRRFELVNQPEYSAADTSAK